MRVLAYSDSRVHSGAEAVFAGICAGLDARVQLTVAVSPGNDGLAGALAAAGVERVREVAPAQGMRLAGLQLWDPRRLGRLRRAVAGEHDALLVNLPSVEYGPSPVLVSRTPAVGLLHVHSPPGDAGFRLGALRSAAARPAMRRFAHLHVVAPGAEAAVARRWGLEPSRVGPLPLSRPRIEAAARGEARAALGLPSDAPVVLLLGRLTILQKGHDVLLDAAAAVRRAVPGTLFLLAGDGPDRGLIEERARAAGFAAAVRLPGPVPAAVALGAADAIAIPSRFEGLPLVALEALAAGVPGVAAAVDGLAAAWPADWLVPPEQPAALAEALVRALTAGEDELAAFRRDGRLAVERLTTSAPHARVLESLMRVARR